MLEKHDLAVQILEKSFFNWTPADSQNWDVTLLLGNLSRGFVFPRAGLALIAESELFGEKRLRKRPGVSVKDHALAAFSDLQVDDYVVHTEHGIGVYRGLWNSSWETRSMTSSCSNTRMEINSTSPSTA